jgi:membrane fusion protein (multidrug efflux system)
MRKAAFATGLSMAMAWWFLFVAAGCGHEEEHHAETGTFPVTSAVRTDTTVVQEYVAQIRSSQHIELRALEGGYLQDIFVDEGQYVRKGQRMFQIMPALYQAEVRKARAEAEFAEIEYRNTKILADSNIVSPNELALAKARLDKAQAEQALAEVHLGFTEVRAPFDGMMDRLEVRLGSLVEEGELLTNLSDNRQMWVYFNVPEAEYLDYMRQPRGADGRSVELVMANGETFGQPGRVTAIEADFDNRTGNIAFRATFPNPDGLLRHGETGNIRMVTRLEDALIIPQKATFEVLDQRYVFVVDEQGTVHSTRITVAEELPHLFAVADGIGENDRILLDGLRKVKDGETINTEFVAPEEVLADLDLYAE